MKKAILIHGTCSKSEFYDTEFPTLSNSHWLPWLSKELMVRDIHVVAIEMPGAFYPVYDVWKKELERFSLDEDTILVGHSCGGGFLARYLSENNVQVGKVILVAPWLGDPGKEMDETFFDFSFDKQMANKTAGLSLFYSTDDDDDILGAVEQITASIDGVKVTKFTNKGHFTFRHLGTTEFSELLNEIIGGEK